MATGYDTKYAPIDAIAMRNRNERRKNSSEKSFHYIQSKGNVYGKDIELGRETRNWLKVSRKILFRLVEEREERSYIIGSD